MMRNNFPHFGFLPFLSKLKAISEQKMFSTAQHHTLYHKCAEIFSLIKNVKGIGINCYKIETTISLTLLINGMCFHTFMIPFIVLICTKYCNH